MVAICPRCHSTRIRPVESGWLYRLAALVRLRPQRCRFCQKLFFRLRHREKRSVNAAR